MQRWPRRLSIQLGNFFRCELGMPMGQAMNYLFGACALLGLAFFTGCSSDQTPAQPTGTELQKAGDVPQAEDTSSEETPVRVSTLPESPQKITQLQIAELFSTTWIADDESTREYAGNAAADDADGNSWQYCVQWKYQGHFKDAGFLVRSKASSEPILYELDWKSPRLSDRLKVIGDERFALRVTETFWLVFRTL